jgi:cell division transport system permease protein
MNIIGFKRILKSGWINFTRNTFVSLSAVLVMVVMLFIISGVIITDRLLSETLSSIEEKVDVNVYFNPDIDESVALSLEEQLKTLPEVERVEYISKEEALERFKERHKENQSTLSALDELGENPLGATLTIKAKNTSQYDSIASFLKNYQSVNLSENHIDKINYFDNKQAIDTLNNVIDGSQKFGFIISVIFIIIAIVITLNTLRLAIYISKNEIHVMNLVGATEGYIRGPFIVTGAIYGIMATFIVMLLLVPISLWMTSIVQNFFIDVNFMDYYIQDFWRLVMWLLISGIVTGAVASSLAVRKYVNSKRR